jgi:ABC-type dipeptide/oligopeptide/nickel transport system ATPase component
MSPPPSSPPRLTIDRLAISIHGTPVVHDISFTVEPGQVVAVVGASGSGKTMTGLALLDLLPPGGRVTAGKARLDGQPIDLDLVGGGGDGDGDGGQPLSRRDLRGRGMAMIFQQPRASLHPMLTIGRQLAEVIARHRGVRRHGPAARRIATELLETAGFGRAADRLHARPHELSGGECQRVMIALALAGEPRVLFADEPTTALDVLVQGRLLERLRDLARARGMGLVLVTHDLRVVAEVADAAVVIDAGRTVEFAACVELFDAPRAAATWRLLAATGLDEPAGPAADPAAAAARAPAASFPRVLTQRPG